jgi:FSR family fosmidomycin resistance protein-like MFS transporter
VRSGVDRKGMAALSTGHLATDLAQGSLAALLPFLVVRFDLSYAMAAALVLAATISSSIVQPLFGLVSDARGGYWLLPVGVAVAGIGMALAAVAPSYPLVLVAVLVAGLGVAAYHPEASKFANYVSGDRRASGMAFFSVGGNLGFALGPFLASTVVLALGLNGGLLLALPGLAVAVLLVAARAHLGRFVPDRVQRDGTTGAGDNPRGLTLLLAVIALRSVVELGNGAPHGTRLLSLFLLAGAVGTIFAGRLADRFGRRPVLRWSFVVSAPLIFVYVVVGGIVGEAALILSGAAVIGTFGVSLVMSQEYMPSRVGMASGLSIGFAIGLGGVAAVILGGIADAIDLETALLATVAGPVLAFVLALALPPSVARRLEPVAASL